MALCVHSREEMWEKMSLQFYIIFHRYMTIMPAMPCMQATCKFQFNVSM